MSSWTPYIYDIEHGQDMQSQFFTSFHQLWGIRAKYRRAYFLLKFCIRKKIFGNYFEYIYSILSWPSKKILCSESTFCIYINSSNTIHCNWPPPPPPNPWRLYHRFNISPILTWRMMFWMKMFRKKIEIIVLHSGSISNVLLPCCIVLFCLLYLYIFCKILRWPSYQNENHILIYSRYSANLLSWTFLTRNYVLVEPFKDLKLKKYSVFSSWQVYADCFIFQVRGHLKRSRYQYT